MPLPLYGSGGRTRRISDAIWPTCCLSIPLTITTVGLGDVERDPLRWVDRHRVREADVQLEARSPERCPVADALDLERLLEPLRDALDHVRDERPRQPVQSAILASLRRTRDHDLVVLLLDSDPLGKLLRELAERTVHHHAARRDRDVHAGGKCNWALTDSAHLTVSSRFSCSALPDETDHFSTDAQLLRPLARDEPAGG